MECEMVSSTVHPRLQGGNHAPITEHSVCATDTHGMAFIVTDDMVSVEHAETKHHALLLAYKTDSGRHHIQSYFFHTIIAMVKFSKDIWSLCYNGVIIHALPRKYCIKFCCSQACTNASSLLR